MTSPAAGPIARAPIGKKSTLHDAWLKGRADQTAGIHSPPIHPDLAREYNQGQEDARNGIDRHYIRQPANYFALDIREGGKLSKKSHGAVIQCTESEIDALKGPNCIGYIGSHTLDKALRRAALMNAGDPRAYGPLDDD